MRYIGILVFLLVMGCNPFKKDQDLSEPLAPSQIQIELQSKLELYCELSTEAADSYGFVHSVGDGLLFTALHETVCGGEQTMKAEIAPGMWCRHPTCPGSKPDFEISPSRLSRDMQLGLFIYLFQYSKVQAFSDIIDHGRAADWEMCDGHYRSDKERLGRCVLSPTLKATLYDLATDTGVICDTICRLSKSVFQVWDPFAKGYQAHLAVLHTDVRGRAEGAINSLQQDFLRSMSERESNNALYTGIHRSFTGGDLEEVAEYLVNSPKWPKDRLPTSKEYCTEYLFQRDEQKKDQEFRVNGDGCVTYYEYVARDNYASKKVCGLNVGESHIVEGMTVNDDWYSCDENKVHAGTDFLYASYKILGGLRRLDP